MAVREWRSAGGILVGAALAALCAAACASSSKSERQPLPPRAVAPESPAPPPSEPPVAIPPKPATVVILDPGEGPAAEAPTSLAEAAARERARRRTADKPVAVINDKNLAEFAKDQKLTIAQGDEEGAEVEPEKSPTAEGSEAWWRERGLEIRRRWHEAVESVERLEGEVAELRTRFYATDDPYLRDSQVKPEWDRRLAELEAARRAVDEGPLEVERFLEEGRLAGVLPGWLREGVELEPEPVLPRADGVEPGEPVVVGQDPP
jgi:hypothetical protein